jgi:hypothetical protein
MQEALMTRRVIGLLVTLAFGFLMAPRAAEAPPAVKVWRIGYLTPAEIPRATLIEPLRELGYVDGQTARFEICKHGHDLLDARAACKHGHD